MIEHVVHLIEAVPWWVWLLAVLAAVPAFLMAWVSALAIGSAAGANHALLTPRQRRLGSYGYWASLLAIPTTAAFGLACLAALLWVVLR